MQISKASRQDLDAILVLLQEREGEAIDREQTANLLFLDGSGGYALIVKDDERVVALSVLQERSAVQSNGTPERNLYWQDLYVAADQRDGRAYILITGHLRKTIQAGDADRIYCVVHRQNVLPMHYARGFKALQTFSMYLSKFWLSLPRRAGKTTAQTADVDAVLGSLNSPKKTGLTQAQWTKEQLTDRLKGRMGHRVISVTKADQIALFSERRIAKFIHIYFPLTQSGKSLLADLKRQAKPGICLFFDLGQESAYKGPKFLVARTYSLIELASKTSQNEGIDFEFIEHDAI